MKKIINHKSLAEHIFQDLENKIIAGILKPGQRIVEEELCRSFGVSRSPVREALRMLESQGFVHREPRRGVSVTKITMKEAEDIYTIRARLDSLAVYLAIKRNKPGVVTKLKKLHEKMIAVAERNDVNEYFRLNQKFHDTIFRESDNRKLVNLLETFDKQTMRYRRMVLRAPGWMKESIQNHEAIIRWFETGDLENAEKTRKSTILSHVQQRFPNNTTEEETDEN
ncbi:MAG: GntR family transcriptional regulator [Thermodesulfobacteriota bacterium]